jgi:hypothetical protein
MPNDPSSAGVVAFYRPEVLAEEFVVIGGDDSALEPVRPFQRPMTKSYDGVRVQEMSLTDNVSWL